MSTTPLTPVRPAPHVPEPQRNRRPLVVRVAAWSARHRTVALVSWLAFVVAAVLVGGSSGMQMLEYSETGAGQSRDADRVLADTSIAEQPVEHVLVSPSSDGGDPAAAADDVRSALAALDPVADVGAAVPAAAQQVLRLDVQIETPPDATPEQADETAEAALPALQDTVAQVAAAHPGVRLELVGPASLDEAISSMVEEDFARAEITSVPVTLLILVVVFGALVAAAVPVLLALSSVAAAIGLAALASHLVPMEQTATSVILLVGMAVGVDYSLFYVRREREERARGARGRDVVELAAATAGHAVVVSGIAVIVSMAGMFLSGSAIFESFGVATILVVAVAVLGATTALPALLATLGHRIDKPRVPFVHRLQRREGQRAQARHWRALLSPVLRRPALALTAGTVALLALAAPVLGMQLASPAIDSLPRDIKVMQAYDRLVSAFPSQSEAHELVLSSEGGAELDQEAVRVATAALVTEAAAAQGFLVEEDLEPVFSRDGSAARIDLPVSEDRAVAESTLSVLREELAPAALDGLDGTSWAVTGQTAGSVDFDAVVVERLPLVIGFVLALTFVVLVVAFRAPVVAVVAIGLNLLSVGAAYGLLVLVFQHTWAEDLLGFTSNGAVVSWLPLFSFVMLFGLSMDYTVLVVSRIREGVDSGLSPRRAVEEGIVRSAGVVTSAAVIMVAVFSIFGTLHLLEFKQLGIGLAAAVLLDATIVRAVLLPAALALLGERAWWAPRWLPGRSTPPRGLIT